MDRGEFTLDGVAYRCRRLSAARQFAMFRRVVPILPALLGADVGLRLKGVTAAQLVLMLQPLCAAPDDVVDAVLADAKDAVERADGEPIGGLRLSTLMSILAEVMTRNFGPLFALERASFTPCPTTDGDKGFGELGPAGLPNGADQLYAPMVAGYCAYTELHDGTLQIEDVMCMNDVIAVRGENEARLRLAAERG